MTAEKLSLEFQDFKAQLKSFILRMTANVHDTEDILQDAYVKAHSKIETFKGDSSIKTWVFSIASNLAKDHLRSKKRWPENVTDICKTAALNNPVFFEEAMQIRHSSPQGQFEIKEHITFCFACISKSLPLEQQLTIFLKEVYEFKIKEIALIINQTDAMVKYYLHTGRTKMSAIFANRCSLINKSGVCHQCSELNGIFNPDQNTEEEMAKISLVKAAENPDSAHLLDLRMEIIKGIDPFHSDSSKLQLHHLEHNRQVIEKYLENN